MLRVGEAGPEKLAATAIPVKHMAASGPTGVESTRFAPEAAAREKNFLEMPVGFPLASEVWVDASKARSALKSDGWRVDASRHPSCTAREHLRS